MVTGCGNKQEPLVLIPNVVGADVGVAQTALTEKGLIPIVKPEENLSVAAGTVLRSEPPAGTYVATAGHVYLYVAAHPAATTTAAAATTTSVSFATTFTLLSPTSSSFISTKASTISTVASTVPSDPCETGHVYTDGACTRCGAVDKNYIPVFAIGETWTVEGQWTFTILGVDRHRPCAGGTETVITLRYRYENIGFDSDLHDLCPDGDVFTVTDGSGVEAALYPCPHKQRPQACAVGETCTAEEVYALSHSGDATLTVSWLAANGSGIRKAQFILPIR